MKLKKVFDQSGTQVWLFSLAATAAEVAGYLETLSRDEVKQSKTFGKPELAERFIVRRGVLRAILAKHLKCDTADLKFGVEEGGKPFLKSHELSFSASNSGEYGLVALSAKHKIGVDIERHNDKLAGLDFRFMAHDEVTEMKATQNETEFFFRIWSRKESVIKSTGAGLAYPLQTLSVLADTVNIPEPVSIQSIPVPEGYSAALATILS